MYQWWLIRPVSKLHCLSGIFVRNNRKCRMTWRGCAQAQGKRDLFFCIETFVTIWTDGLGQADKQKPFFRRDGPVLAEAFPGCYTWVSFDRWPGGWNVLKKERCMVMGSPMTFCRKSWSGLCKINAVVGVVSTGRRGFVFPKGRVFSLLFKMTT